MWCQITSATFCMRASQDPFTHLCGVQQNEMFVSTLFEKSEPQPPVANRGPLENDLLKSCHGRSSELADKVWGTVFHPSRWGTGENTTTQWGWRCRWLWTHPSFSCHRWSFYLPEFIKRLTVTDCCHAYLSVKLNIVHFCQDAVDAKFALLTSQFSCIRSVASLLAVAFLCSFIATEIKMQHNNKQYCYQFVQKEVKLKNNLPRCSQWAAVTADYRVGCSTLTAKCNWFTVSLH